MSKAEKEKVNIEKVAILLRNVLVFLGIATIAMGFITSYFENAEIENYIFFPIIIGSVIFLLIKSNSSAYRK